MIDPVLERDIEEVKNLLGLWNAFSGLVAEARGGAAVEEARESDFKKARDELARDYPALMERLEVSCGDQDDLLCVLGRISSLGAAAKMPDIQWRKVEEMEGRAEVSLRGILGLLEARKRQLGEARRCRIIIRRIVSSWAFKLLCLAAGIILFFLVLESVL